ncbi:ICOS ligand isoform X2 [Podarcis lilfordi]|uniref:ICOS ligand isoform X2 n=1 Tax=Podarcis lilfordi TaxID=74358 RepID=A0AA35P5H8_9SAUR|nr:ICOS ligand isoform X2 [Podarcis lilfordi]
MRRHGASRAARAPISSGREGRRRLRLGARPRESPLSSLPFPPREGEASASCGASFAAGSFLKEAAAPEKQRAAPLGRRRRPTAAHHPRLSICGCKASPRGNFGVRRWRREGRPAGGSSCPRAEAAAAAATMVPKRFGFMMFLWVQTAANISVTGIIGSTVELRCDELNGTFILNNFRVTWRKEGEIKCFVETYDSDEDLTSYRKKNQCADFRDRTRFTEELKEGKFTLQLLRISPKDEFTYTCVVLRKNEERKFEVHREVKTNLKVAANYSAPVLTHMLSGEEMTFNCTSSHGYPQPKVYWVNHTDISLLNSTQQYTRAPDGTISVFSMLTVKAATAIKLECTIENEQLHQNLTASIDTSSPENSPSVDNSPKKEDFCSMTYTAPAEIGNRNFGLPE